MESSIAPSAPELNLVQRLIGTFTSPRKVFESLRERPRFLGAFLIIVILSVVIGVLITPYTINAQLDAMAERGTQTPPEAQARVEQTMKVTVPIFSGLGIAVVVFALSGVYLFLANIVLGGSTTYRRVLAAVAHIGFVSIPSSIVKIPLMMAKGTVNVQTSLAALLPADGDKGFLYHLLARTDIFELWMWGLGIVAVSVMAGITTGKAARGVVGVWLILSLLLVLLGTLVPGMNTM
jgi:hypothetical protein